MLHINNDSNHLTILYQDTVIQEIVNWVNEFVLDENQSVSFTPRDVSLSVYILLMGGVILIGTIIAIVFNFFGTPISLENKLQEIDWRSILKQGSQAIVVAGVAGSLVTAIIVFGLMVISPLIFTNFIVAAFLGNSITLWIFGEKKAKIEE